MKCFFYLFYLALPTLVFPQNNPSFQIIDTSFQVKQIWIDRFEHEELEYLLSSWDSMSSALQSIAFVEVESSMLGERKTITTHQFRSLGNCVTWNKKTEIAYGVGFTHGLGISIFPDLMERSYIASLSLYADDTNMYKLSHNDSYAELIKLEFLESKLMFLTEPAFTHKQKIKGIFSGETVKYFEKDNSEHTFKEIQLKIKVYFQCKVEDFDKLIFDKISSQIGNLFIFVLM